jgi:hypothetical protein
MKPSRTIDLDLINSLFYYDESSVTCLRHAKDNKGTGIRKRKKDSVAGFKKEKYIVVTINGQQHLVHRIICAMHGLDVSKNQVDHINGNYEDNRISNLRVVSHKQNARNQKISTKNTSGFVGLSRVFASGSYQWAASWKAFGKTFYKSFSVRKYGEWHAFAKACESRAAGIKDAEKDGIKFTDRHLLGQFPAMERANK